ASFFDLDFASAATGTNPKHRAANKAFVRMDLMGTSLSKAAQRSQRTRATDERVVARLRSKREHLPGYPTSNMSELLGFLATAFRALISRSGETRRASGRAAALLSGFVLRAFRVPADVSKRPPPLLIPHADATCGGDTEVHMNPLFAALVLTATTHFNIGAQVVRSTSLSVEQAHHGASTAVQVAGLTDDKRAAILVEASRGVEVRFVAGGSFETRGSGVVRVTLFADGAPPLGRRSRRRAGIAGAGRPEDDRRIAPG